MANQQLSTSHHPHNTAQSNTDPHTPMVTYGKVQSKHHSLPPDCEDHLYESIKTTGKINETKDTSEIRHETVSTKPKTVKKRRRRSKRESEPEANYDSFLSQKHQAYPGVLEDKYNPFQSGSCVERDSDGATNESLHSTENSGSIQEATVAEEHQYTEYNDAAHTDDEHKVYWSENELYQSQNNGIGLPVVSIANKMKSQVVHVQAEANNQIYETEMLENELNNGVQRQSQENQDHFYEMFDQSGNRISDISFHDNELYETAENNQRNTQCGESEDTGECRYETYADTENEECDMVRRDVTMMLTDPGESNMLQDDELNEIIMESYTVEDERDVRYESCGEEDNSNGDCLVTEVNVKSIDTVDSSWPDTNQNEHRYENVGKHMKTLQYMCEPYLVELNGLDKQSDEHSNDVKDKMSGTYTGIPNEVNDKMSGTCISVSQIHDDKQKHDITQYKTAVDSIISHGEVTSITTGLMNIQEANKREHQLAHVKGTVSDNGKQICNVSEKPCQPKDVSGGSVDIHGRVVTQDDDCPEYDFQWSCTTMYDSSSATDNIIVQVADEKIANNALQITQNSSKATSNVSTNPDEDLSSWSKHNIPKVTRKGRPYYENVSVYKAQDGNAETLDAKPVLVYNHQTESI